METIRYPGEILRDTLRETGFLQVVGALNAYTGILAAQAGFSALYVSGAGVSNASLGKPDLGLTTIRDVLIDTARLVRATSLPVLVDADTGFGRIGETVAMLEAVGAAGLHIEDQVDKKRCGHRSGKVLVTIDAMCARLRQAILARKHASFVIMARCDALENEGIEATVVRCKAYIAAGADMIFVDGVTNEAEYRILARLPVPVLANITEFGRTPLFTVEELKEFGVQLALYPLSAFRAMNLAAQEVYQTIHEKGTQASLIPKMQTREALYKTLGYEKLEAEQRP
ncbi:MAG: methylisocitrate lyase [Gammaproteobacteria bacterium]